MARTPNRNSNRKQIPLRKRGLILCEGETEIEYFNGLISHEDNKTKLTGVKVEIYKPRNHSPKGLVKEALKKCKEEKNFGNPYDFVWVLFDNDGHADIPAAFNMVETNNVYKIKIGFTNRCFEYFILLHFEYTTRAFNTCDDIISYIRNSHLADYGKADRQLYETLYKFKNKGLENTDRVMQSLQHETDRGRKPYELSYYANIHELVNFLERL